jgi:glycerol kinase
MGKFVGALDQGTQVPGLLMQIQADVLNVPVIRPRIAETTALGAAYAAGLAVGFWSSQEELRQNWSEDRSWQPTQPEEERAAGYGNWKRTVEKTFDWVQ